MLIKLNASPKDLYDLGAGAFILKDRYQALIDLTNDYDKKLNELMKDYNFALSGFTYELANHEYNITYDYDSTLEALNLTEEEILNNDVLLKAFKEARKTVIENSIYQIQFLLGLFFLKKNKKKIPCKYKKPKSGNNKGRKKKTKVKGVGKNEKYKRASNHKQGKLSKTK